MEYDEACSLAAAYSERIKQNEQQLNQEQVNNENCNVLVTEVKWILVMFTM